MPRGTCSPKAWLVGPGLAQDRRPLHTHGPPGPGWGGQDRPGGLRAERSAWLRVRQAVGSWALCFQPGEGPHGDGRSRVCQAEAGPSES